MWYVDSEGIIHAVKDQSERHIMVEERSECFVVSVGKWHDDGFEVDAEYDLHFNFLALLLILGKEHTVIREDGKYRMLIDTLCLDLLKIHTDCCVVIDHDEVCLKVDSSGEIICASEFSTGTPTRVLLELLNNAYFGD